MNFKQAIGIKIAINILTFLYTPNTGNSRRNSETFFKLSMISFATRILDPLLILEENQEMAVTGQTLLKEVQQQRNDLKLPALLKREFQTAATAAKNETLSSSCNKATFRIMQWNLLAQALSQGDDNFVMCPLEALEWDHRKLHILEEILAYDATIVCLEEVDHFKYIKDMMSKVGYDGCFFPKPDSPCLYSVVNYGPDGCAVFWKTAEMKLELVKNIILENDEGLETNQVAILCKFTHLAAEKNFYVAVTHLKSKCPYWQLRLEQGKYLERVLSENVSESSPLIVCGDFNAEPNEQVYAVFQSSQLNLDSAYCHLTDKLEEPSYTTWKIRGSSKGNYEYVHCIDYVWFTRKHLHPVSLLKFPTGEQMGKDRLPSLTYPSDHLSLVVDFAFSG